MQRVAVHNHFNVRPLGIIEISDEHHALLQKPPQLVAQGTMKVLSEDPDTGYVRFKEVPNYVREPHIIVIETDAGEMRLFPVGVNGDTFVGTDTPDVVEANLVKRA